MRCSLSSFVSFKTIKTILNLLSVIRAVWRKRRRNRSDVVASWLQNNQIRCKVTRSGLSWFAATCKVHPLTAVFWPKPESRSNKCSYKLIFWDLPFPKRPFTSSAMDDIGASFWPCVVSFFYLFILFYLILIHFAYALEKMHVLHCFLKVTFVQTKKLAIASESCDVYGHYLWLSIINSIRVVKTITLQKTRKKKV